METPTPLLDRSGRLSSSRASGAGNWLGRGQASQLLNAPDPQTLKGKRVIDASLKEV